MPTRRRLIGALATLPVLACLPARAEDRVVIDARVNRALAILFAQVPESVELSQRARAMLVMPEVLKGGLIVGGAYGEGALLENRGSYGLPALGYYSVAAASVGLQLGVQTTSHALFFMTDQALADFRRADGWEVGIDAEVTFPEKGLNAQTSTTIHDKPVLAIVFGQDGFLVGASLEGAKYSPIVR